MREREKERQREIKVTVQKGFSQLGHLGQIPLPPVFVNKVLFGNNHGHQFHIVYVYLSPLTAELNCYNTAHATHQA